MDSEFIFINCVGNADTLIRVEEKKPISQGIEFYFGEFVRILLFT